MEEQSVPTWYLPLIKGAIMVLLAILVFTNPDGSLMDWVLYIGIGLVITGMVLIYQGFAGRETEENWTWNVFEGLLDMFMGFLLMVNPLISANILPFMFGLWGAFYGIALFIDAFAHKGDRIFKFIISLLVFYISTLIMFNPELFGMTLSFWVGAILFMVGIYNVVFSFGLKKLELA